MRARVSFHRTLAASQPTRIASMTPRVMNTTLNATVTTDVRRFTGGYLVEYSLVLVERRQAYG
jgi:hypothetical protein